MGKGLVGMSKDCPVLVIDGNFLCHKAKYSMGKLSAKDIRTGVIFSFFKDLIRLMLKFQTNDIIFAWDSKESLRAQEFPAYKEKRHSEELSPEEKRENKEMYRQIDELKEKILPVIGFWNQRWQKGYEGDDIIASTVMDEPISRFIVIANDQDLWQLLDLCNIYNFKTELDEETFTQEWGITPEQWGDVKVLGGCSTDEVPGIPGIGAKKAAEYLRGAMNPKTKTYKKIEEHKRAIYTQNVPLVVLPKEGTKEFDYFENDLDIVALMEVFEDYNFQSFLKPDNFREWKYCFEGRF
jgi:5'-3' exonuclease